MLLWCRKEVIRRRMWQKESIPALGSIGTRTGGTRSGGRAAAGGVGQSAMVVRLSDRVEVELFKQVGPVSEVAPDEIAVSGLGTIAAARVTPRDGSEPFIAVSVNAKWVKPHPTPTYLGDIPPAEFGAAYAARQANPQTVGNQ